jgi:hypothetical protein
LQDEISRLDEEVDRLHDQVHLFTRLLTINILCALQAAGCLLPACDFKHTHREANQVAHCLAQTALRQQQCVVMLLNAPTGVHALLDRKAPGWALAGNPCNSVLPS